jgi:hypothetical protein
VDTSTPTLAAVAAPSEAKVRASVATLPTEHRTRESVVVVHTLAALAPTDAPDGPQTRIHISYALHALAALSYRTSQVT